MAVVGFGQTVVTERFDVVLRALQALEQTELDHMLIGIPLGGIKQLLHMHAIAQIAHLITKAAGDFSKAIQLIKIRIFMHPIHRGLLPTFQRKRHRVIGSEHAFFDELMAAGMNDLPHLAGLAFFIENDAELRKLEIERAQTKTQFAHARCHFPCFSHHRHDSGVAKILAIEHRLRFFVGELGTTVNHCVKKLGFADLSRVIDLQ